jgi:cation:H+ antiporter
VDLGLGGLALVFVAAAAIVVAAGIVLARSGDAIAEETGLSRMTVGLILLALATSLPEIVTDVSAALVGAPDLAIGDLFGSSMANMAILALVDLVARRRVFPQTELRQARLATGAIALTALAVFAALVPSPAVVGWVGVNTIIIGAGYLAMLAWLRGAPADLRPIPASTPEAGRGPALPIAVTLEAGTSEAVEPPVATTGRDRRRLRRALATFGGGAVAILVAAPVLAVAGKDLAHTTGASDTFVGTALLAVVTSLPELAASIAAVRIGAVDLAVGNLFGSNAFNMSVLLVVDIAYTPGAVLDATSQTALVPGIGAILLTTLGMAAVLHGRAARAWRLEPDAILILVAYAAILLMTAGIPR